MPALSGGLSAPRRLHRAEGLWLSMCFLRGMTATLILWSPSPRPPGCPAGDGCSVRPCPQPLPQVPLPAEGLDLRPVCRARPAAPCPLGVPGWRSAPSPARARPGACPRGRTACPHPEPRAQPRAPRAFSHGPESAHKAGACLRLGAQVRPLLPGPAPTPDPE